MKINVTSTYVYQGLTGSGTPIDGAVPYEVPALDCQTIQDVLVDLKSPDSYPVDCDFITLSGTGVVFFMEPVNQQLVRSVEISTTTTATTINSLTKDDIEFMYKIEGALIFLVLLVILLIRQFRKMPSPSNFF